MGFKIGVMFFRPRRPPFAAAGGPTEPYAGWRPEASSRRVQPAARGKKIGDAAWEDRVACFSAIVLTPITENREHRK
jgi:hypothetical protein